MFYENNFSNLSIIYNSLQAALVLPVLQLCPGRQRKNRTSSAALCKVMETQLYWHHYSKQGLCAVICLGPGAPSHGLWKRNPLLVSTPVKVKNRSKDVSFTKTAKLSIFLCIIFMFVFLRLKMHWAFFNLFSASQPQMTVKAFIECNTWNKGF